MHTVALVVYPQFQSMSLAVSSVFECANLLYGEPIYVFTLVSEEGGAVVSSEGFSVNTLRLDRSSYDTIFVAGFLGMGVHSPGLISSLVEVSRKSRRIASLCTGIFALAEAGLLAGKRVTTHWLHVPEFKRRYPAVQLEVDRLFVVDGQIWTGAGMSAGVDLALAMVENDLGSTLARDIARKLVIVQRRGSKQSQHSALLDLDPKSDRIQQALAYARDHLSSDLSVSVLAKVARLSPRQFSRVFREETGKSPAKAIEILRVESARVMMETSRHPIEVIARETGFKDRERMRQAFLRAFGKPPQLMRSALCESAADSS
ncbi:GlxA family transcriptional regulator [Pseudomonas shirazica]|uniref:GlxA family transcriptional regulator n=1 Tax=Pseudomonas putida group TaxID=136845 RepID=UPI0015965631|nr:GlxA family transcriptional regulator [Pseudomonas urethralis]